MTTHANKPRIASLLASGTEIVHGLGSADRLVAISHECDWPQEVLDRPRVTRSRVDDSQPSGAIDTQVKEMVRAGAALYEVDTESLQAARPDVIITQVQCDVCAVSYDDVVSVVADSEALRNARIVAMNPTTLEDVFRDIRTIGDAIDEPQAATAYEASLRKRLKAIADTVPTNENERPRIICIEWIEPLMVAANWMPDLIHAAGGRCDMTESGKHSTYTKWDDVMAYDPDAIVVSPCGFDLNRTVREAEALKQVSGWSNLRAVREGRAYAVDGNAYFNRSGPRLVDSVEILAAIVDPNNRPPSHPNAVRQLGA